METENGVVKLCVCVCVCVCGGGNQNEVNHKVTHMNYV